MDLEALRFGGQDKQESTPPHDLPGSVPSHKYLIDLATFHGFGGFEEVWMEAWRERGFASLWRPVGRHPFSGGLEAWSAALGALLPLCVEWLDPP